MSKLDPGHPIGYLFRRQLKNLNGGWKPVVDHCILKSKNLFRKNLYAHYGCVNAVEFSHDGDILISGGDDRRVLLWRVSKAIYNKEEPRVMQAEHGSNVFALAMDRGMEKIFSAGNDDQVIVHDVETTAPLDYFIHEQPVYGVSVSPTNDSVFCSAGDDGRLLIYDIREPSSSDPFCLASVSSPFHAVMFHPVEPRMVLSGNSKEGVALWDVRRPKLPLMRYGGLNADHCCMSARFNSDGSKILALRRRLPPVLYSTRDTAHLFQFHHTGYYNSCTMKSCSFAGNDDQYVLSGSDNFDLYMWKIPPPGSDRWVDGAHMVLRGHRSIVNQVRYNKPHAVVVSSGVEKLIKVWSPFTLSSDRPFGYPAQFNSYEKERRIYSHAEYINLVTQSGPFMSLTYDANRKSTREDPRMMAFFDALVQRDIEGWSDDSDHITEHSYTVVSEVESSEEESDVGPPDSSARTFVTSSSRMNSESDNVESNVGSTGTFSTGRISSIQDFDSNIESESDSIHPPEVGDLILTQSATDSQDFPRASSPTLGNNSDSDDPFKRNLDQDSDMSAPIVNSDANIIKTLISKKHERLRLLARAQILLENAKIKKPTRKRKQAYVVPTSSDSSDEDQVSIYGSRRKRFRMNGTEACPTPSSEASTSSTTRHSSEEKTVLTNGASKSSYACGNLSGKSRDSKRISRKKMLEKFKRLRYEKKGGESKNGNFCSYFCKQSKRYHPVESSSGRGSEEEPCTSSKKSVSSNQIHQDSSNSSSSSSSSTSSSSSSDSNSDTDNSNDRLKPRPCSSPQLIPKDKVSSSDSGGDDVPHQLRAEPSVTDEEDEEAMIRVKTSSACNVSPLIRRIEIERLNKLRRLERRRAAGNMFSSKSAQEGAYSGSNQRTWSSSSSDSNTGESTAALIKTAHTVPSSEDRRRSSSASREVGCHDSYFLDPSNLDVDSVNGEQDPLAVCPSDSNSSSDRISSPAHNLPELFPEVQTGSFQEDADAETVDHPCDEPLEEILCTDWDEDIGDQ